MLNHYAKVVKKIYSDQFTYSRILLLLSYLRLVIRSIIFHKLLRKGTSIKKVKRIKLLGMHIQFFGYPQLINLFEEIFIFQVYQFESSSENPAIIDCGSNIGLSVLYFKKVYPKSDIMAFEPDYETFQLLKINILQNNISGVSLFNSALSDREGEAILYKRESTPGFLGMSLKANEHLSLLENVKVNLLSNYINNAVHLLKVDVEGSEGEILRDLVNNNKLKLVNRMIIETHPHSEAISGQQLISIIGGHSFKCWEVKTRLNNKTFETTIHGQNLRMNLLAESLQ